VEGGVAPEESSDEDRETYCNWRP